MTGIKQDNYRAENTEGTGEEGIRADVRIKSKGKEKRRGCVGHVGYESTSMGMMRDCEAGENH